MTRRPRRSLAATLAALVLLSACVLTATDAIQIQVHSHPWLSWHRFARYLHGLHWNGTVVAVTAGVLIALGVIALLAALLPGRPVLIALRGGQAEGEEPGAGAAPLPDAGVSRRGLAAALRTAAASVDGVTSAKLSLHRHAVAATVYTLGSTEGITDDVRAALEKCLDRIAPAARFAVRVRASVRSA